MKQQKKSSGRIRPAGPAPSFTDPQGSWTGVPADPTEKPVQDTDDL